MARLIRKVAVLGAGTMGARIAAHLENAGVPSLLLDMGPPDANPGSPAAPAGSGSAFNPNRIAAAGLQGAKKTKPAAFPDPSLAPLARIGNFPEHLMLIRVSDSVLVAV